MGWLLLPLRFHTTRSPVFFVICLLRACLTPSARLLRDVPEKAEAFLRWALLPASCELLISVAICAWLAAPDRRKASFFQTHHGAGLGGWRVVVYY
jgi:hypothetical protein